MLLNDDQLTCPSLMVILIFLLAAIIPQAAGAEEAPVSIVLLTVEACCPEVAWPEVERAFRAELFSLAMALEVRQARSPKERDLEAELKGITERGEAMGAVAILRPVGRGGEMYLSVGASGRSLSKHVLFKATTDIDAARLAALQAVEALRASLQELGLLESPQTVTELPAPPALGLALGVGPLGSPGGGGVRGEFTLAMGWRPLHQMSVWAEGWVAPLGSPISQGDEAATLITAGFRAWVLWEILNQGLFRPAVGLGGGPLWAWSEGQKSNSAMAISDSTTVGYLGLTARLSFALMRPLWLELGTRVGFLLPSLKILFLHDQKAQMGLPLVEGFGGLCVNFL